MLRGAREEYSLKILFSIKKYKQREQVQSLSHKHMGLGGWRGWLPGPRNRLKAACLTMCLDVRVHSPVPPDALPRLTGSGNGDALMMWKSRGSHSQAH